MPNFNTKKWIEVNDQSLMINANDRYKPSKQISLKHLCYDQIFVIIAMNILLSTE